MFFLEPEIVKDKANRAPITKPRDIRMTFLIVNYGFQPFYEKHTLNTDAILDVFDYPNLLNMFIRILTILTYLFYLFKNN